MKLYELSSSYSHLMELIENEEIDAESLEDTIEAIESGIEEKFENIAKMIKHLDGQVAMFKEEEDRLKSRRASMENKVKWLKEYLLNSLEVTGKDKIVAGTFTVAKQKNNPSLLVKDVSKIPDKFRIPQEDKIDSKAVLKEIKEGKPVEGAEIAPIKFHVRIR